MTFAAPFGKTFRGVFGDSTATAVTYTWYGVGGWHPSAPFPAEAAIDAANVQAVYQPHWGAGTVFARSDAASYANSKVNIANPGTYNLTDGVAPSWSSTTGWTFTNANPGKYLLTGITPASGWSYLVCYDAYQSGINANLLGVRSDVNAYYYLTSGSTTLTFYYGSGSRLSAGMGGLPLLVATTVGMSGNTAYINGLSIGAASGSWSGVNTGQIYLGNINPTSWAIGCRMFGYAIYNTPLTANQMANVTWGLEKISGRIP